MKVAGFLALGCVLLVASEEDTRDISSDEAPSLVVLASPDWNVTLVTSSQKSEFLLPRSNCEFYLSRAGNGSGDGDGEFSYINSGVANFTVFYRVRGVQIAYRPWKAPQRFGYVEVDSVIVKEYYRTMQDLTFFTRRYLSTTWGHLKFGILGRFFPGMTPCLFWSFYGGDQEFRSPYPSAMMRGVGHIRVDHHWTQSEILDHIQKFKLEPECQD